MIAILTISIKKIEKLDRIIKNKSLDYEEFGNIEFKSNDYQNELKNLLKILPMLRNEKAFIFIDPYEYKHIKASQIKKLLESGNSEVLLWLPIQFMYRFSSRGTPQALQGFIDEFTQYENWKDVDSVWKLISQLKTSFQTYLDKEYFVDTFTIQKDKNTVFYLFFFSSHMKGFEKMLEAKWKIDTDEGKGWNFRENQLSLFQQYKTNPLEEKLKQFLKGGQRYNGEVFEFTLRESFLPKHTIEIFKYWQQSGILDVISLTGKKARKGSFYVSYKHFRDDGKKVYYKLR